MSEILEDLVDRHGLEAVLAELSDICYGKAEHIADNWQDVELSKRWQRCGRVVNTAATRQVVMRTSPIHGG